MEEPRGIAVIVHGLCEHCGRYDYVTERLNAAGYSVYRFDHRGHGRSEGKPVYYDQWDEISNDVFDVIQLAKEENPGKKLIVLGHSMGGYAVTCFGTRFPKEADAIVLSGALTRYNHKLAGDLPIQAPADMYVPNALGEGVCSDPAVIKAYTEDPTGFNLLYRSYGRSSGCQGNVHRSSEFHLCRCSVSERKRGLFRSACAHPARGK